MSFCQAKGPSIHPEGGPPRPWCRESATHDRHPTRWYAKAETIATRTPLPSRLTRRSSAPSGIYAMAFRRIGRKAFMIFNMCIFLDTTQMQRIIWHGRWRACDHVTDHNPASAHRGLRGKGRLRRAIMMCPPAVVLFSPTKTEWGREAHSGRTCNARRRKTVEVAQRTARGKFRIALRAISP